MRATADVWSRFKDQVSEFEPTSLIIVTWYRIAESPEGPEVSQLIIVTDLCCTCAYRQTQQQLHYMTLYIFIDVEHISVCDCY